MQLFHIWQLFIQKNLLIYLFKYQKFVYFMQINMGISLDLQRPTARLRLQASAAQAF